MIVSPILSVYISSSNSEIKKNLKCENIPIWNEEEIMKREFEEERKRIQPTGNYPSRKFYSPSSELPHQEFRKHLYNFNGELIEYAELGIELDIIA